MPPSETVLHLHRLSSYGWGMLVGSAILAAGIASIVRATKHNGTSTEDPKAPGTPSA